MTPSKEEPRYFDKSNNRLIYILQKATPDFWDSHWEPDNLLREKIMGVKSSYVTRVTNNYLKPADGIILEGGCGRAQHVAALTNSDYQCIGIDSAAQTVQTLQSAIPELDVRLGDVLHLDFEHAYFAGYWSMGVIEHFWDGYEPIGREMARVIRPGGYLFLTFPYMSPLRKLKARLGFYPKWQASQMPASFYQFALDHKRVVLDFTEWGFDLVQSKPMYGLKGTKDEIAILKRYLQPLYDYKGSFLPIRAVRFVLSNVLSLLAGHSILLVFKRGSTKFRR